MMKTQQMMIILVYAEAYYDCDDNCLNDIDDDGICDELEINGCTDTLACNYDEMK